MTNLSGNFYSNSFTTTLNGDLITQFRSECGDSGAILKKLTFVAGADIAISINGGAASHLYLDTDGLYKLSLDSRDIIVSSFKTGTAGQTVWLAGIW